MDLSVAAVQVRLREIGDYLLLSPQEAQVRKAKYLTLFFPFLAGGFVFAARPLCSQLIAGSPEVHVWS